MSQKFPPPSVDRPPSIFDDPPRPPAPAQSTPPQKRRAFPPYVTNLALFVATIASVLFVGSDPTVEGGPGSVASLLSGWKFAVPLMTILLAHEFGHYIAAKVHHVPASLPYFIPLPISIIGTMGAVILMRGRIGSRNALLDIGASGPLAGMVFAVPILIGGLLLSDVKEVSGHGFVEGQCLLYSFLKWVTVGSIPDGSDVFLHPAAFAGWVGLLVTMINLMPVGQLDGGHIAYSLFGPFQNKLAKYFHFGLIGVFFVNLTVNLVERMNTLEPWDNVIKALEMSAFWPLWFVILFGMRWFSGGNHPPTEPGELGLGRRVIAIGTLVLFVLLFMPTPMSTY